MTTTKQQNKYLYVVTYIIALVCLLLGMLLPLYDGKLLVTMLPSALGCLFKSDSLITTGTLFTNSVEVNFFGLFTFDISALTVLLYVLLTAIGIILLIPMFLSKKHSKTARVLAYIVEVAALIVLFVNLFNRMGMETIYTGKFDPCYALIIALAGVLVMLVIQSIAAKKGSGVIKIIMLILGIVTVFVLLDLTVILGLNSQYGNLYSLFAVDAEGRDYSGYAALTYFARMEDLYIFGTTTAGKLAFYFVSLAALLAIVNFIIDLISASAKSTKGGLVFDCCRYVIEVVLTALSIVFLFVVDGEPGLMLYILLIAAIIEAVISIIRAVAYRKEEVYEESEEEAEEETVTVELTPEPEQEHKPEYVAPAESLPLVESQIIYKEKYDGPVDSFISRLSENEKIEFYKMFIEKINGPFENIPDYVVDGDNRDFFVSVFIYLGKFLPTVSAGLMDKMYTELNLLR